MAGQNRSLEFWLGANIRVAGTRNDKYPGVPFGGTYYPAGRNSQGIEVPARWEGQVYINRGSYIDQQGVRRDRKSDIIKLVIFNGRGRTDGKGAADNAAKYLAPGKEISLLGNLHSFDGRVFVDGNTINNKMGEIAKTLKHSVTVIPGTLILGADGDKQLALEYAMYQRDPNTFSFWSRPLGWAPNHPEHQRWLDLSRVRAASVYQGGDIFGYAIVGNTAQSITPPMAAPDFAAQGIAQGMAYNNGGTMLENAGTQYNQGYQAPAQQYSQPVQNQAPMMNQAPPTNMPNITPQGVQSSGQLPNLPGQVNQAINQPQQMPGQVPQSNMPNMPYQQFNTGAQAGQGGQPF